MERLSFGYGFAPRIGRDNYKALDRYNAAELVRRGTLIESEGLERPLSLPGCSG